MRSPATTCSACLAEVWRATRKTVVYVTHNVAEAVYLADRVVVMTPHPGTVKAQVAIDLARPRDPLSVEFLEHQKELLRHLGRRLAERTADPQDVRRQISVGTSLTEKHDAQKACRIAPR